MNREEMIALRNSLRTISTSGDDTIRMAGCLNFLSRKINEYVEKPASKSGPVEEIKEDVPENEQE